MTEPRLIRMHENNNVAIVVNDGGLEPGAMFSDGLEVRDRVPQGHKIALVDLREGQAVVRYNVVIGYALRDIAAAVWSVIHLPKQSWAKLSSSVCMPAPPPDSIDE